MNVKIIDHPVLQHKLSILRDIKTKPSGFRRVLGEMSRLMAYEVCRDFRTSKINIKTPMGDAEGVYLNDNFIIVSIMRAGNGMIDGVTQVLSSASVGHIGIYSNKFTDSTVEYYFRLPENSEGKRAIILDPLLGTGATAIAAISRLKDYKIGEIRFLSVLATTEGIEHIKKFFPDVIIYCLSIEKGLNSEGYILPGLGDAGKRLYGTD